MCSCVRYWLKGFVAGLTGLWCRYARLFWGQREAYALLWTSTVACLKAELECWAGLGWNRFAVVGGQYSIFRCSTTVVWVAQLISARQCKRQLSQVSYLPYLRANY